MNKESHQVNSIPAGKEGNRVPPRVWAPLVLWMVLMLTLSSIPGKAMPRIGLWNWDKLAHAAEYLVLSLLLVRYIRHTPLRPHAIVVALGAGILFGLLDELHQLMIPNRMCSWQDFLADSGGVVLGGVGMKWFAPDGRLRVARAPDTANRRAGNNT